MHSVLRGAGVQLGEDSCKIRIGLRHAVQHCAARHILEGRFAVKSNKDSGVMSFRKVLDGLDHRVLLRLVFQHRTARVPHAWPLILSLLPLLI